MPTSRSTKPADNGITSEVVLVTPEMARELLGLNIHNRPIRQTVVNAYARDMKNGNWMYAGDPVRLGRRSDSREILLDGQHRLLAISKADVPIQLKIERGYPEEVQRVIDTNATRSLSDQIKIEGYTNANAQTAVAVARRVYSWVYYGHPSNKIGKTTHSEIRAILVDPKWGPMIEEASTFARANSSSHLITVSLIGTMHVVLSDLDPDQADWFLRRVDDGAELPAVHPIMRLRQKLVRDSGGDLRLRKLNDLTQAAYLVMAWNLYRKGNREVTKIQLPRGGVSTFNFPKPI